jgi:transposase
MTFVNTQKYIGLDIHKSFIYAVVLNLDGDLIFEQKIRNDPYELDKFLSKLEKDSKIALESCSCWEYIFDYLIDSGFVNVFLANPSRVRLIATSRKKTDAHDAKVLADLLRTNMLPLSYAPSIDIRDQRIITRHRTSLTRLKVNIKNKIHATLIRNGINHGFSDVFCEEGINFLQTLDLRDVERYEINNYISLLRHLNNQTSRTEDRIKDFVETNPSVRLLMTMPGVSYNSGFTIDGEIGDIRRFNSAKELVCFAGLNPSVSQSGNKCYTGHIAKQGNKHLRFMLGQCALIAIMHEKTLAKFYHRIKKRRGHNIAITATARKMLCFMFTMLKNNLNYQALQIHKNKAL